MGRGSRRFLCRVWLPQTANLPHRHSLTPFAALIPSFPHPPPSFPPFSPVIPAILPRHSHVVPAPSHVHSHAPPRHSREGGNLVACRVWLPQTANLPHRHSHVLPRHSRTLPHPYPRSPPSIPTLPPVIPTLPPHRSRTLPRPFPHPSPHSPPLYRHTRTLPRHSREGGNLAAQVRRAPMGIPARDAENAPSGTHDKRPPHAPASEVGPSALRAPSIDARGVLTEEARIG